MPILSPVDKILGPGLRDLRWLTVVSPLLTWVVVSPLLAWVVVFPLLTWGVVQGDFVDLLTWGVLQDGMWECERRVGVSTDAFQALLIFLLSKRLSQFVVRFSVD